jgi:hypothetical protein
MAAESGDIEAHPHELAVRLESVEPDSRPEVHQALPVGVEWCGVRQGVSGDASQSCLGQETSQTVAL